MSDTNNNDSANLVAGADPFLIDLQQEFLADPDGHLKTLREGLSAVSSDPLAGIRTVIKLCETIPPLAEPAGFQHLAALLSEFEVILRDLEGAYASLGGVYKDDDTRVLEFFLGDAIASIENYYSDLKVDLKDNESRANERRPSMRVLSNWRPAIPVAAIQPQPETLAVATSETQVVAEAPAPQAAGIDAVPAAEVVPASMPAPAPAPVEAAPSAVKDNLVELRPKAAGASQGDGSSNEAGEPAEGTGLLHQYLICRASMTDSPTRSEYRSFAIPVRQVLEVIDYQVVNPLPYSRPGISGMLNFRGDPLPIMICEDHGGDAAATRWKRKGYIVIARINDRTFGFQMEQVLSVAVLNPSDFQQPDEILGMGASTWVTHLVRQENEVVMVMDLNRALAA